MTTLPVVTSLGQNSLRTPVCRTTKPNQTLHYAWPNESRHTNAYGDDAGCRLTRTENPRVGSSILSLATINLSRLLVPDATRSRLCRDRFDVIYPTLAAALDCQPTSSGWPNRWNDRRLPGTILAS